MFLKKRRLDDIDDESLLDQGTDPAAASDVRRSQADVFPEATKDTFVEYMAANPEDTETTQRMKMPANCF